MLIIELIYNLAILVTVSIVSGFVDARWDHGRTVGKILQGITFGCIAILAMLNPYVLSAGIIFDGRSIVLSLCALFFGPIGGAIAGGMALVTRLAIGGGGWLMGASVIVSSTVIGLIFHSLKRRHRFPVSVKNLYLFGMAVHIVMLVLMTSLPKNFVWVTFQTIAVSVIVFYPAATVLIGKILIDQEARAHLFNELRESEEKFRTLVQYSNDPICAFNPDVTFRFANEAFAKTFGLAPADLIGKQLPLLASEEESKDQVELIRRVLNTGVNAEAIIPIRTIGGEVRHYLSNIDAMKDEKGRVLWISCFAKDITERRQAEEELKESEVRYRNLLEVAPVGIAVHSEGRIVFTNPAGKKILGADAVEQLIGKPIAEIIHPDRLEHSGERIRRMMAGEQGLYPVEDVYVRLDGRPIDVEVVASPLTFNGKQAVQVVVTDITERKHAEAALREMQERLKQSEKMESIGQLAGGIAHDFNNVLSGIIGFTDMSLRFAERESKLEGNLLKVLKAADRAKRLVQQILTFSRQSTPPSDVTVLEPIITEALELLRASIPSSVLIETQLHHDTKPVLADPTSLHEVMINLATNAVHAMDGKGTLSVRLYGVTLGHAEYGRTGEILPGDYTVIEVADTGRGMDAATIARAFDPFYTTKGVGEGTGMGLSVVLGIVQSHHGHIQLESVAGSGTTVKIFLPITGEHPAGTTAGDSLDQIRGSERIVFVDDEPMLVEMHVDWLTAVGYSVNGFSDSREALEFIRAHPAEFDLLITDQTMPNITGIELAKESRKIRHDLPVILCTGFSREANPELTAANGISRLLMKPYGNKELTKSIRSVLDLNEKE
jgi:PAS domain S-box-containing protein